MGPFQSKLMDPKHREPDNKVIERIQDKLYEPDYCCSTCEDEQEHGARIAEAEAVAADAEYDRYKERETGAI